MPRNTCRKPLVFSLISIFATATAAYAQVDSDPFFAAPSNTAPRIQQRNTRTAQPSTRTAQPGTRSVQPSPFQQPQQQQPRRQGQTYGSPYGSPYGQPQKTRQAYRSARPGLRSYFGPFTGTVYGGMTLAPSSKYIVNGNGLTTNTADKDKGAYAFGLEAMFRLADSFGLGLMLESSSYKYLDMTVAEKSDSAWGFYLAPRFQTSPSSVTFWGGVGLGIVMTPIGRALPTGDGMYLRSDSLAPCLSASPRIGFDFNLSQNFLIGVQASYTYIKGSLTLNTGTISYTEDFTRTFLGASARLGFRL